MSDRRYPSRFRLLLAASMAVSLGSLSALGWIVLDRPARPQLPASPRVTQAIGNAAANLETEWATPGVKRSTADTPWDKALRVRDAIKRGDFAAAHHLTEAVAAASRLQNWRYYPFEDFIGGIADVADPGFGTRLDEWVARNNGDPVPLLIRAQYYYERGWFARGHDFSNRTAAAHMADFENDMKKALADIDMAIAADGGDPYPFYLKLRILHGFGWSEKMQTAFSAAISKYPGYYPLYDIELSTLEPKWGGRIAAMYAFVERYAGQAAEYSPMKFLYIALYRDLLNSAAIACDYYRRDQATAARCVASAMDKTATPELEKQVVAALQLYDHSDKYQFEIAVEKLLFDMLDTSGGDSYSGAVLQLAASAMHSNTQLNEEKPGHNDYVIDETVAESWYVKGFYDSALEKNQEALNDIRHAVFPSEQEKNAEIAGIYRRIAGISGRQARYSDMIAYEKAAIALAGSTEDQHFICYAHYRLKNFAEAVRACTRAIENRPGNLAARYWRGMAYRDSGQKDAALRDLAAVAASENGFRFNAAINMSVIYAERHDPRSELEILNRNATLYDPRIDSIKDVAIAYNNRCHAYMHLGELKKALADCTASLRYGSLPDAYRKQQELIKRLAAHESNL